MTKITKREMYEAIKAVMETGESTVDPADIVAFCDKEIETLANRAAKAKERAAAKKAEADVLYDTVRDALTDEYQTIADIAAALAENDPEITASKITYRLTKLCEAGEAEKTQMAVPTADGKKRKVNGYRAI
jgi:hypothetical protein